MGGINIFPAAMQLMKKYDIEMPIKSTVDSIINFGRDPTTVACELMDKEKIWVFKVAFRYVNYYQAAVRDKEIWDEESNYLWYL